MVCSAIVPAIELLTSRHHLVTFLVALEAVVHAICLRKGQSALFVFVATIGPAEFVVLGQRQSCKEDKD